MKTKISGTLIVPNIPYQTKAKAFFSVGDEVVDPLNLQLGIGEIKYIEEFYYIIQFGRDSYEVTFEEDLISIEIYNSPLYKTLNEKE